MTVSRHVLDNGLTVLLKEVHSAPVISWWVLYRIGSRNEPTGKTGISHWVEHMMFKGTPRYPAGVLDREIDRLGGMWNAQTGTDFTAYYATLPADRIGLAIDLEADRMVNAEFTPEDVESERTVIISERQGLENSPLFWLTEEMMASAFRVHGYHHDIIGDLTDLETMTRDDLYDHYQRYYFPGNAVVVAVGAFDTAAMLAQIKEHYGAVSAGEPPKRFMRPEPPQNGERRVCVERPGTTAFLQVGYRVPEATDEDWTALVLLASVLSGPTGIGGGEIDNKTSRLYRALVETELAASVNGGIQPSMDPFIYEITVTLRDESTLVEVESAFDTQIDNLRENGITQAELDRARKQARAMFAYSTESVTEQAYWLAFSENLGDAHWFDNYTQRLSAVTLDAINAAAQTYLRPQHRVVGWLVPTRLDIDQREDIDYA